MAEFTGKDLVVEFICATGTLTLPQVQKVSVKPENAGLERKEATHAGDARKQYTEGIPDAPWDKVTISALDETGTASVWKTLNGTAGFTFGTLLIYPQGKATLLQKQTGTGKMQKPSFERGYADLNTVEVVFELDQAAGWVLTEGVQ